MGLSNANDGALRLSGGERHAGGDLVCAAHRANISAPEDNTPTIAPEIFVPASEKHNGSTIVAKCAIVTTAIIAVVGSSPGAIAQALSPPPVYEGEATVTAKNGATEAVHISVQTWGIAGQEQEISLRGFYVAHLLTGQILATIDGQTAQHLPGDYWTVNAGSAMRVKVVGEVAVLETTVVSKQ
jgi:hypothetical protein